MTTYTIYTLTNPNDEHVFYVGVTKNYTLRLRDHRRLHKQRLGFIPTMEVVEETQAETLIETTSLETYWIQQFKCWGFHLINKNQKQLYVPNFPKKPKNKRIPRNRVIEGWLTGFSEQWLASIND